MFAVIMATTRRLGDLEVEEGALALLGVLAVLIPFGAALALLRIWDHAKRADDELGSGRVKHIHAEIGHGRLARLDGEIGYGAMKRLERAAENQGPVPGRIESIRAEIGYGRLERLEQEVGHGRLARIEAELGTGTIAALERMAMNQAAAVRRLEEKIDRLGAGRTPVRWRRTG